MMRRLHIQLQAGVWLADVHVPPRHESPRWTQWAQTHKFSVWANIQEETSAESTLGRLIMTCVRAQCCEKERKNKQKGTLAFVRCFFADHLPRADSTAASREEIQSLRVQPKVLKNSFARWILLLKPLQNNSLRLLPVCVRDDLSTGCFSVWCVALNLNRFHRIVCSLFYRTASYVWLYHKYYWFALNQITSHHVWSYIASYHNAIFLCRSISW